MRSDNNATISLASMVGFDQVAALARNAGIKSAQGTPSMAIGSYDATPLDMAGAYTVFSNGGMHIDPWMLASVRTPTGDIVEDYTPTTRAGTRSARCLPDHLHDGSGSSGQRKRSCKVGGLDYCGTGAGVRNMGFTSPAAGKTGTSHDAWFAGFTINLLCIVWVGNDDYTDLPQAAAPGRARRRSHLGDVHEASRTVAAVLRHQRLHGAGRRSDVRPSTRPPTCWPTAPARTTYAAAFLDGTAPTDTCDHKGGMNGDDHRNIFQKIFGIGKPNN